MALVAGGIWSEWFKIDAALDHAGFRTRSAIKDIRKCAVVILANETPERLAKGALEQIRQFVSEGGGLVVLGGLGAFANGGYQGTLLEEMLPVSLKQSYIEFFPTDEQGSVLTRASQSDWPLKFDFQSKPAAFYFHQLIPKGSAKVQVMVGNQPAIVSGSFGRGRVVACALTVNGEPPPGALPFWEWKDWPALLGEAVTWASGARPTGTSPPPPVVKSKPLSDEEITSAQLGLAELPKDFVQRALASPNEKIAQLLLNLVAPQSQSADPLALVLPTRSAAKCSLDAVLPALLPFAKPEWAPQIKSLTDTSNPNIASRRAAVLLLGACRDPSAAPALLSALRDKSTELAALDGLGLLGSREAIGSVRSRFDAVLKSARLPEGPDRFKPAEFAESSAQAAHAAIALYRMGDSEAVPRLCDYARNLHLYLRIMRNASKRWPRDPVGQQKLAEIVAHADALQAAWDFLVSNASPIPPSQADAFVQLALTADDPVAVEFLATAMEQSAWRLPKANWATLCNAKSGIVRRMGRAIAGNAQ